MKRKKTMKSSTTNKNDALSNKTYQMNKVTDCIVSTTSTQTIINVDHPLVKLGYVIFEMSGDLKKTLPQYDESTRKFTLLFNNKRLSNRNILGSDDKKRLHHQIDHV